jgi:hypothetical protein
VDALPRPSVVRAPGPDPLGAQGRGRCASWWRRPRAGGSTTPTGQGLPSPGRAVRRSRGVPRSGAGRRGARLGAVPDTVEPVTHLWAEAGRRRRATTRPGRRVRGAHPPGRRAGLRGLGPGPRHARLSTTARMGLPADGRHRRLCVSPGRFPRSRPGVAPPGLVRTACQRSPPSRSPTHQPTPTTTRRASRWRDSGRPSRTPRPAPLVPGPLAGAWPGWGGVRDPPAFAAPGAEAAGRGAGGRARRRAGWPCRGAGRGRPGPPGCPGRRGRAVRADPGGGHRPAAGRRRGAGSRRPGPQGRGRRAWPAPVPGRDRAGRPGERGRGHGGGPRRPFDGGRFTGWFGRIDCPGRPRVVDGPPAQAADRPGRQDRQRGPRADPAHRRPHPGSGAGGTSGTAGAATDRRGRGGARSWPGGRERIDRAGAEAALLAAAAARPGRRSGLPIGERPPSVGAAGGPGAPPTGPPPCSGRRSR